MLTFYHGSRLDLLADRLFGLFDEQPLAEPLEQEIVIVQNHGMARWLSTQMSRKRGIAANLKFEFPAERVWDLYRTMDEEIPKDLPSDREPMTWTIYGLLKDISQKSPYLAVWHYMRTDDGEWSPLKAWKLAGRIGDLFDQYLVYRPEMLLKWDRGETTGTEAAEAWQAEFWQQLKEVWEKSGLRWTHRPTIHSAFMENLHNEDGLKDVLPQRITLFGLSSLPPAFIELFTQLAHITDIHWFWPNPAAGMPFSSLIESWGGVGKNFEDLFQRFMSSNVIPMETVSVGNSDSNPGTRLESHTLDLFESTNSTLNTQHSTVPIQVHSCHSPLREVEVLHNNLLDLFENDPSLDPDDILVMCPDPETYAPFIRAVFGTPEEHLPSLPYHIVDDHTGATKEAYNTFSKLLHLLDSRFKVTEVLDLLAARVVREKFDISEDELERIQNWIQDTNIRWGLSGEDKKRQNLPGTSLFTWISGLDRMMLGFASQMEDEIFQDIYPYEQVESSEDAALLGKFSRFLNALKEARSDSRQAYPPQKWAALLEKWVQTFIPDDQLYYRAYQGLNGLIDKMEKAVSLGKFSGELEYPVILDYLEGRLSEEAGRGGYFGHGITFSGLDQMRNIPFKVIGMIGMDNEAFPRNKVSPDFDLMSRNPRPGDRSRRDDDRYLFLEAMNAAKELFYLSYVGQSNRDDSTRPPSVMISELLDHLKEFQNIEPSEILIKHPLQAYSRHYFSNNNREDHFFSYSRTAYRVIEKLLENEVNSGTRNFLSDGERLPEADESFKQLSIDDLIRFYQHPAQFLVQQRLGIHFYEENLVSDDREPFELSGLAGYKLGDELLIRRLNNKQVDQYEPVARARGMLPDGWPGHREFQDKREEVEEFSSLVEQLLDQPKLQRREVSLECGEFQLTGVLDSIYRDHQLFLRYGSMRAKDLIRLWIHHLVLQQIPGLDHSYQSMLITKKKSQPELYRLPQLEPAQDHLTVLAELYWKGLHQKIPLFTDTSFTYAHEIVLNGREPEEALKKAHGQWENSWRPEFGEKEDPYYKLLFSGGDHIGNQEFRDISLSIWEPVFEVLKQGGGEV